MKNVILLLLSVCGMLACTHTPKWELVWEDNLMVRNLIPQYGAAYLAEDLIGKILSHLIIVVMKCVMVV